MVFDFKHNNPTGDTEAGGDIRWTADGLAVTTNTSDQTIPQFSIVGISPQIFWVDARSGQNAIYKSNIAGEGEVTENTKVINQFAREIVQKYESCNKFR